jgi:outer membrane protein assembly factor BamB
MVWGCCDYWDLDTEPQPIDQERLRVLWTAEFDIVNPETPPLVVDDMIIHSGGSEIEALNLHTGEKLWGHEIEGGRGIISRYLGYDAYRHNIFFSHINIFSDSKEDSREFRVIDAATGKEELRFTDIAAWLDGHEVLPDGYVIVGDTTDAYRINVNGQLLEEYSFDLVIASAIYNNGILYFSQAETIHGALTLGGILAVDVASGDSLWAYNTQYGGFHWAKTILEEGVLYAGSIGNGDKYVFVALDVATGSPIWEYQTSEYLEFGESSVLGPEFVYYRSHMFIFALNKATGEKAWTFKWSSSSGVNMVYLGGYVYLSNHSRIFVLDGQTGELVHEEPFAETGGFYWSLAASKDKVFAQTGFHLIAYEPWHLRQQE